MIFKIQIYTLRISEYYRESIEMKLTKRQFNIQLVYSFCLCLSTTRISLVHFLFKFSLVSEKSMYLKAIDYFGKFVLP